MRATNRFVACVTACCAIATHARQWPGVSGACFAMGEAAGIAGAIAAALGDRPADVAVATFRDRLATHGVFLG